MSSWAIVAIVAIVIWGFVQVFTRRHDRDRDITRDKDGNPVFPPADNAAERREIESLRERIKVLERIATDNNSLDAQETRRIEAEIENLREEQDRIGN
ncbi:MAG: hypothetical protein ACR2FJ_03345 [Qipengyuania sp.]